MRKDPTVSIRISAVLAERIAHLQKDFKSTKGINALAEYALESMVEMLEAEESVRRYPDILLQIDAVNRGEIAYVEPKPGTKRIRPEVLRHWMVSKERGGSQTS